MPDKVVVRDKLVSAASAQDAINAAVRENKKDRSAKEEAGFGVRMVRFPSGLGFVSTGMATYSVVENPVATRIAKRKAYVIAYTQAKRGLAEMLGGLTSEGKETVRQALTNINLPKDELNSISVQSEEAINQALDMMLRGFEIYEVKDDPNQRVVHVSIVTTPRTRQRLARPALNAIETKDLREGLEQVIREIRAGVVPPVGGRIIMLRETGEPALIGFGSAVVHTSTNAAVQAKLNLEAQKMAAMRAKDALCGLIAGDQVAWKGSIVESLKDEFRDFQALQANDPLAKEHPAGVKRLEKSQRLFESVYRSEEVYTSARKGILPPGIQTRTWFDDDHAWVYAISVYLPSISKAASEAAQEMKNGASPASPGTTPSASEFLDERNPAVKRPGTTVGPGASGKVGNDKDR
ncbi:MAG: hypothetical protein NZ700_01195 [Gemmataceae bacterium]|nr:hypothetical protein [Gemmataceae bacterium]MDW8265659.1 hypothetical protein [Gemmataceae bacterium]